MKSGKEKGFREGAMMVALTAVLVLLTKYIPFLTFANSILCCIPLAVLAIRNNFKVLIPAMLSALIITWVIDGNILFAVSTFLMAYLPGVVMGYMLGRRKSFFITLFSSAFVICLGWIIELLAIKFLIGTDITALFAEIFESTRSMMLEMVKALNLNPDAEINLSPEEFVTNLMAVTENTIRLFFPSMIIIGSIITGYIMIRVTGFIARRARLADIEPMSFSLLMAPKSMSTAAVIFYLIYIFTDTSSALWPALGNLIFVLYTVIGICGLSVIDFKLKNNIKSPILRFLIYVTAFLFGGMLMGIISTTLIIIGILDSKRNFRNIKTSTSD